MAIESRRAWALVVAVFLFAPSGPAARAQDGGVAASPVQGVTAEPGVLDYGVYEPAVILGESARVTVRCLGATRPSNDLRGRGTAARFVLEVENTTSHRLELVPDDLYMDWARADRLPRRALRPERIDGETKLAPSRRSRVRVVFPLEGDPDPTDVSVLRLRWAVRSGTGAVLVFRSVFIREHPGGRLLLSPAFDPYTDIGVIPTK